MICACKTLHDHEKAHILVEELHSMIKLKDDNIVKLLGVSTDRKKISLVSNSIMFDLCLGYRDSETINSSSSFDYLTTFLKS